MIDLLQKLLAIVLLRQGPQDLPPGQATMLTCLALYVLTTAASLTGAQQPEQPVLVLGLALALPLLLSRLVLTLANKIARWPQTVSALFGSSAVLSALSLPLGWMAGEQPTPLVGLLLVTLFFWSLAVNGHVWRHALEVAFSGGLAIAVLMFAINLFIINALAGSI
ncbi:MAG: hypothetical protein LAT56_03245 [Wenzhouxiangella sp.]|nr:hypothetical protein [Wenzhouxiangella sp.]